MLFAGCREKELINGVDSRQSIEIVVVLNRAGINAERTKQFKGRSESFFVTVDNDNYARALEVLHEYGLPRRNQEELDNITRSSGIAPDAVGMGALRREIALSLQVEKLLLAFPGVVDARVIIRSENSSFNPFHNNPTPPRATVVLRYISAGDKPDFSEDEVRRLVARSVSGLEENNVVVSFSKVLGTLGVSGSSANDRVVRLTPFRFKVLESDLKIAKRQLLGVLILLLIIGGAIGIFLSYVSKRIASSRTQSNQPLLDDNRLVIEPNPAKLTTRRPTLMFKSRGPLNDENPKT